MSAPPVTNPTPHTCPNCGAGLAERAEFCPLCGASLQPKTAKRAGWIFGSIMSGLGALIFGGVGACSGLFSYESLTTNDSEFGQSLLVISVPLLLIGLAGAFLCGRALLRRVRESTYNSR